MVLRQGMRPAIVGIVVGLIVSWFGARVLGSMLYGVTPQDPVTLASVTVILVVVVAAATILPARRASRVPPSIALRSE